MRIAYGFLWCFLGKLKTFSIAVCKVLDDFIADGGDVVETMLKRKESQYEVELNDTSMVSYHQVSSPGPC